MPERVALLLPGVSYSAERPLLHFAGAVFEKHGWSTRAVQWPEPPPERDGQGFAEWFARSRAFVDAYTSGLLDRAKASRIALVGKSLGTFAAGQAADRGLPAVWLTPVLADSPVPADLRRATAPYLLVGSAVDPSWDRAVARDLGAPCYEAPDADHSMETPGDPVRSAEILREVTAAIDAFVSEALP